MRDAGKIQSESPVDHIQHVQKPQNNEDLEEFKKLINIE